MDSVDSEDDGFDSSVKWKGPILPEDIMSQIRQHAPGFDSRVLDALQPLIAPRVNSWQETLLALQLKLDVPFPKHQIVEDTLKSFADTARFAQKSLSVDSFYSAAQLLSAASKGVSKPRASRTPEEFFGEHIVEIRDVASMLKAFSVVQRKHYVHRPVWRGQVNAAWAVHSSLHRRLEATGTVNEDRLVEAEVSALALAQDWGISSQRPLELLATLQHEGAPTRLMDATLDPEIAAWFAVESEAENDDFPGMVLGWGRSSRKSAREVNDVDERIPVDDPWLFWHPWDDDQQRRHVDWGTGTKTWTWFPPALTERMRAQRAGFLIEAGPILTDGVVDVFSEELSQDWTASEISRATSIIGLPSRHDVLTKPNAANLVPIFAFKILHSAKKEIREYLEGKGLTSSKIYPDLSGLVRYLPGAL